MTDVLDVWLDGRFAGGIMRGEQEQVEFIYDGDYRGELFMVFVCASSFSWKKGDRIAQGIVVPVAHCRFDLVAELPATARGIGGFGSTGA